MTHFIKNFIEYLVKIFKLSATPPSIIYPLPLFAFLVFSLSGSKSLKALAVAVAFTFVSQAGINLWNHVNDLEEDLIAGKRNVLTQNPELRSKVATLSFLLYAFSFTILCVYSKDVKISISAFALVALATWIYSDRLIAGKFIRRWKDHYVTEVLTYVVSIPMYTVAVWTLFSRLTLRTLCVAFLMTFFMLSGTFLKDLKDATGDEKAGLKTLAVVFSPSALIKTSTFFSFLYYLSTAVFSCLFLPSALLALTPFPAFVYSVYSLHRENWIISRRVVKTIRTFIFSNLLSLTLLATAGLVFRA